MPIELNKQETDRFGFRAARLQDLDVDFATLQKAASDLDVQFLSVRVPTNNLKKVQQFERLGFQLMDTLVYYDRDLEGVSKTVDTSIRLSNPSDAAAVSDVARQAFTGYFGHYHADERLRNEEADEVYVEWATNSILNASPAAPATVMEHDGQIFSFLTMRITESDLGELILVGVRPDAQGKGVYGRLIDHGLSVLKEMGCTKVVTSTQINNIAVQRAWAKRGFRMQRSYYTLHKWMDTP